jgi:hypothetical protein
VTDDSADPNRQVHALYELQDELMSILHAHPLRQPLVDSAKVTDWLRGLYDIVQEGLGKPRHFDVGENAN